MTKAVEDVEVVGKLEPHFQEILSPEALRFVTDLHNEFNPRRQELLKNRARRQTEIDSGKFPDFLSETSAIRQADWRVAEAPADLLDRRVEITGPLKEKW